MKAIKRLAAFFIVMSLMMTMFNVQGVLSVSGASGNFSVTCLKTNGESCPVIDSNPSFSWQMESNEIGKQQTAYQISVKCDGVAVWDSGKQKSDVSVGIDYDGPALDSSKAYSWTVTVWDEKGVSVTSEQAMFETGLGSGSSAWSGSEWIAGRSSLDSDNEAPDSLHYVVEADVSINGTTAVGVIFNATYENTKSFLMWQVNSDSQIKGAVVLRPHRYVNGSWVNIANINVTGIIPDVTVDSLKTKPIHLKIDVTKSVINTYINDTLVDSNRPFPTAAGLSPVLGAIGAHSGGNEGGVLDNLKLTDYTSPNTDGTVVYNYDFNDGVNPLSYNAINSNKNSKVENGVLVMNGNGVALPPLPGSNLHYTVEADVAVEKSAVGIILNYKDSRNMLLWQINTATSGQVRIRPHKRIGGTWSVVDPFAVNVSGVTNKNGKTDPMHLMIDVTNTTITTYINGTQVNSRSASAMGMQPMIGLVGGHSGDGEGGYIDNLKMIDYTDNAAGTIVYSYDFDDGINPLTGDAHSNFDPSPVVDGRLYQNGNRWSLPPEDMNSPFPSFRKKIDVNKNVEWARLYSTALGAFDMYIDGERVGCDELKPGYTAASKRVHYYTYDVTDALKTSGTHLVSAQLAKGWYGGLSGEVSKTLALRAKLLIKYAGQAEPVVIGTDSSWKTDYPSGFIFASIYDGETFNGNMGDDWRTDADYDDSAWGKATVLTDWNGIIEPVSGSRVRVREDLTRNEYTATVYNGATGANDDGYGKINVVGNYSQNDLFILRKGETAVIDFGQNFAGWSEITASGAKDTVVQMRTGEMLNDMNGLKSRGNDGPEGSVYHANYRSAASTARYIMTGEGDETYHSTYTFYGFRYIELTASEDITVKGMRGLVLTSMLDDIGTIETSDSDVNQLISNIRWGGYSNLLSIPTDCPQRNERSGWTADTQVFSTTALYLSDLQNFYIKWMEDMRDAARASDGAFRTIAPINETEGYEAGWSDAGVIVPYNVYKMTGDKRILEENWDAMQKFMDVYMASTNKNGGGTRYGDWVALENNEEDVKRLCAIAYYAGDALMMAEMAEALGKTSDAAKYRDVYEVEKAYFQQKYVNSDGSLRRTEQTSCLMALAYDLLPNDASKETVKEMLLSNLESHGNKLQTGFLGTAIIMQTLTQIGAEDMAYKLLLQHEFPSWLYCVDLGATTTWERWNSYTLEDGFKYKRMNSNDPANMNSFNHYAYGAVAEWMYSYMAGIMYNFDNPGFKSIELKPYPDRSLEFVDCSYNSAYGTIKSTWRYDKDNFYYDVTVPANTTATVSVPVENGKYLLVGGKSVQDITSADGLVYTGTKDGRAVFEAVSGSFSFCVSDNVKADYTAVNEAIAKATAVDRDKYTADTLAALDAAVAAVVYDLTADKQSQVNAMAAAINDAIEKLIPKSMEFSIDISDGAVTAGDNGRFNITWNANVILGADTNIDYINANAVFKSYGVCYGMSKEAVAQKIAGTETSAAKTEVFDNGDDIDVYTVFGFRLKGVYSGKTRAAMFFITYEMDGKEYTVYSDCVTVVP